MLFATNVTYFENLAAGSTSSPPTPTTSPCAALRRHRHREGTAVQPGRRD